MSFLSSLFGPPNVPVKTRSKKPGQRKKPRVVRRVVHGQEYPFYRTKNLGKALERSGIHHILTGIRNSEWERFKDNGHKMRWHPHIINSYKINYDNTPVLYVPGQRGYKQPKVPAGRNSFQPLGNLVHYELRLPRGEFSVAGFFPREYLYLDIALVPGNEETRKRSERYVSFNVIGYRENNVTGNIDAAYSKLTRGIEKSTLNKYVKEALNSISA